MKHVADPSILPCVKNMLSLLQQAEQLEGVSYVQATLTYLFKSSSVKEREQFLKTIEEVDLSSKTKGAIMTVEEYFIKKGVAQGMEKGIAMVAIKLLQEKLPLEQVSRFTGLSQAQLEQLRDQQIL